MRLPRITFGKLFLNSIHVPDGRDKEAHQKETVKTFREVLSKYFVSKLLGNKDDIQKLRGRNKSELMVGKIYHLSCALVNGRVDANCQETYGLKITKPSDDASMLSTLLDKINQLEIQVGSLTKAKLALEERCVKLEAKVNAIEKKKGFPYVTVNSSNTSPVRKRNRDNNLILSSVPLAETPGTNISTSESHSYASPYNQSFARMVSHSRQPPLEGFRQVIGPNNKSKPESTAAHSSRASNKDEQSKKTSRSRTLFIGKGTTGSGIAGAPRRHYFCIRRLRPETNTDILATFVSSFLKCESKHVEVEEIALKYNNYYRSFRVTVGRIYSKEMNNMDNWPSGVEIKRYFFPNLKILPQSYRTHQTMLLLLGRTWSRNNGYKIVYV